MSEEEPCVHDWVMREGSCETCGGHDYLHCDNCWDYIDPYSHGDKQRWAEVLASGRWRHA